MNGETSVIPLSEHAHIIIRAERLRKMSPRPTAFAVVGRVCRRDKFTDIIRVDNSPHQNQNGTHVHFLDKGKRKNIEKVEYVPDISTPWQAYAYVEKYLKNRYPEVL